MKLKKKEKIIISVIVFIIIIFSLLFIGFKLFSKIKNSHFLKIGEAFNKTMSVSSTEFELNYKKDTNTIKANGNLELNLEKFTLLGNINSNKGDIVISVTKNKSRLAYYVTSINYWIALDITEKASEIMENIMGSKENYLENFPIQDILKLTEIDDVIDISNYPNKLSRSFIISFIDDDFLNNTLKFRIEEENNTITYYINPNIYELLLKFIKKSKIKIKEKNILIEELKENKQNLEEINLNLSISINEEGYMTKFVYNNSDATNIIFNLNNINNTKVEIENKVLKKISK